MPPDGLSGGAGMARILNKIAAAAAGKPEVRVGFLENSTYPDGTQTATIAALNEFGSGNTPPRPFFRSMIAEKKGEWGPALGVLLAKNNYDILKSLRMSGEGIAGQLVASIDAFTDPALAPSTIAKKSRGGVGNLHGVAGPSKPLIDTGHMRNSVSVETSNE